MASSKFHFSEDKTERRIILIGQDGSGKSATGNTILGKKCFQLRASYKPISKKCSCGRAKRFRKKLRVIDTPALCDTGIGNEESIKEFLRCLRLSSPGPDAFVLVIPFGIFTKEEQDTVQFFREIFGEEMFNHTVVLLTLWDDIERQNIDIQEYLLKEATIELVSLVQKCNGQVLAINNKQKRKKDAKRIIKLVDKVIKKNGGRYYSNGMCIEADKQTAQSMEENSQKEIETEKQRREIKGEIPTEHLEKIENVEKHCREIETKMHEHRVEDQDLGEKRFRDLTTKLNEMKKMIEDMTEQVYTRRETATAQENKMNELDLKCKEIEEMKKEEQEKKGKEGAVGMVCDGVKMAWNGVAEGYKGLTSYF